MLILMTFLVWPSYSSEYVGGKGHTFYLFMYDLIQELSKMNICFITYYYFYYCCYYYTTTAAAAATTTTTRVSHNQGVTKFALPSKNEGHHGAKVMFLMFCPNPSP